MSQGDQQADVDLTASGPSHAQIRARVQAEGYGDDVDIEHGGVQYRTRVRDGAGLPAALSLNAQHGKVMGSPSDE